MWDGDSHPHQKKRKDCLTLLKQIISSHFQLLHLLWKLQLAQSYFPFLASLPSFCCSVESLEHIMADRVQFIMDRMAVTFREMEQFEVFTQVSTNTCCTSCTASVSHFLSLYHEITSYCCIWVNYHSTGGSQISGEEADRLRVQAASATADTCRLLRISAVRAGPGGAPGSAMSQAEQGTTRRYSRYRILERAHQQAPQAAVSIHETHLIRI